MNKRRDLMIIIGIIILSVAIRLVSLSFPHFTSDEARIAYRGYTIAAYAKDELDRFLPLLFNSLTDYQLPAVTYITALGEIIFGKTDVGARMPFMVFGIVLIILVYKIAQLFNDKKEFWIISALVLVFSPSLVFLSKVPNDLIVLTCFITLLFYLLTSKRFNMILIIFVVFLSLTVSKFAWFIMPPFVIFTLICFQSHISRRAKTILSVLSLILALIAIGLYLQIPQSKRSLMENNFPIFSSTTIKNGINKSRGQGISSGWPNYSEVILFNKADFLTVGFMHWLSHLQPGNYFGQFDKTGQLNFSQMGALQKVLIIPFILGLFYLIKRGQKKERLLLVFFVILTFPAIFIYPNSSQKLIVLTLPFAALVIAFGLMKYKRSISILILSITILELALTFLFLAPEKKNTNFLRPDWMKDLTRDIYAQSIQFKTAVSDDIAEDILTFIQWYNPVGFPGTVLDVPYPYKYRQSSIGNIKIIGSDNEFYSCKENRYDKVYISKRDLDKVTVLKIKVIKTYTDNLNQEIAYLTEEGLCIK